MYIARIRYYLMACAVSTQAIQIENLISRGVSDTDCLRLQNGLVIAMYDSDACYWQWVSTHTHDNPYHTILTNPHQSSPHTRDDD